MILVSRNVRRGKNLMNKPEKRMFPFAKNAFTKRVEWQTDYDDKDTIQHLTPCCGLFPTDCLPKLWCGSDFAVFGSYLRAIYSEPQTYDSYYEYLLHSYRFERSPMQVQHEIRFFFLTWLKPENFVHFKNDAKTLRRNFWNNKLIKHLILHHIVCMP